MKTHNGNTTIDKTKYKLDCAGPELRTHGISLAIPVSHAWWPLTIQHQTNWNREKKKNEPNDCWSAQYRAMEEKEKGWWRGRKGGWQRWEWMVNLWRIKGVCVYLSSPIDHHLLQVEWGRERSVQLGFLYTLLHCSRGSCAAKQRGWSGSVSASHADAWSTH